MVVPNPAKPNEVRLQSMVTNRYVKLQPVTGSAMALVASAETLEDAASFIRSGEASETSFLASNGKYVSAPAANPKPQPMTVQADRPGPRERFSLEPTLP